MDSMNYYDELGIGQAATDEEIHKAYRRVARLLHPDQQPEPALKLLAERQMMRLNSIVDVLLIPSKRLAYDAGLNSVSELPSAPPLTIVVPAKPEPTAFSKFCTAAVTRLHDQYPSPFDLAQKALTSLRLVSRVSWACGLSVGLSLLIWALAKSAYHNPSAADAASVVHAKSTPIVMPRVPTPQRAASPVPRRVASVPVIVAQSARPVHLVLNPAPAKRDVSRKRPFREVLVVSPVQPRVVPTQSPGPTPSIDWTTNDTALPSDDMLGTKQGDVPGPPAVPPSELSGHGKRRRHQSAPVN